MKLCMRLRDQEEHMELEDTRKIEESLRHLTDTTHQALSDVTKIDKVIKEAGSVSSYLAEMIE